MVQGHRDRSSRTKLKSLFLKQCPCYCIASLLFILPPWNISTQNGGINIHRTSIPGSKARWNKWSNNQAGFIYFFLCVFCLCMTIQYICCYKILCSFHKLRKIKGRRCSRKVVWNKADLRAYKEDFRPNGLWEIFAKLN